MDTLDTHTGKIIEACALSNIPMDFLVPYLNDKSGEFITDMLDSILAYVDKIPGDSIQGERIKEHRKTKGKGKTHQTDPLVEVGRQHQHALEKWLVAADASLSGNWDTPDCERLFEERWKHIRILQSTQATSLKGLLAQFNMIEGEFSNGGFVKDSEGHIEIQGKTLNNMRNALEALVAQAGRIS